MCSIVCKHIHKEFVIFQVYVKLFSPIKIENSDETNAEPKENVCHKEENNLLGSSLHYSNNDSPVKLEKPLKPNSDVSNKVCVKEDIDFYKDKVGTIASTEYKKGGLIKGYPKLAQRGWK
jgi:hypothetical protein